MQELIHPLSASPREPFPQSFPQWIQTYRLTPEEGLGIYSRGYTLRMRDALSADFPATHSVLGCAAFDSVLEDYLSARPSCSYSLADAGDRLPAFLSEHASRVSFPYLVDLAYLEWKIVESFYSPSLPLLEPDWAGSIPQEKLSELRFGLDPSVKLLGLDWTLFELWRDHRDPSLLSFIRPEKKKQFLAIYRDGAPRYGTIQVETLSLSQMKVLLWIAEGLNLSGICERLAEVSSDESSDDSLGTSLMSWFPTWIQGGIIRQLQLDS